MGAQLREAVEAVIAALDVGRDRLGRLEHAGRGEGEALRRLAVRYDIGANADRIGSRDRVDQAVAVLKAALCRHIVEAAPDLACGSCRSTLLTFREAGVLVCGRCSARVAY